MAIRQYTAAQLLALRSSPLVVKPDNLPAIEQWIEYVYLETADGTREKLRIHHSDAQQSGGRGDTTQKDARQKQQRPALGVAAAGTTEASSPMGAFSTGRPTLGSRSTTLRGKDGDDISLGPPRTMFPSSRNVSKLSDFQSTSDATPGDETDNARSRFFSDRQLNRRSQNSEKEGRDNRDSWTSVRERREGQKDREDRFGRHDKEDGERRNGFGERHDPRWGGSREERRNGERPAGGWREREQQRRDRDGDHRGHHNEREPEWMDDPVVKKDQELGFGEAKTQEDFQKWKESMSKKTKGDPEPGPEKPLEDIIPQAQAAASAPPEPKQPVAPLKLDGFENGLFGGWGTAAPAPNVVTPGGTAAPKPAASGKGKTSRFASMFKPAAEEPPPAPPQPTVEETSLQKAANGMATASAEDQAGFNRVLQMLGSVKMAQPTPPQDQTPASPPLLKTAGTNGTSKPKSRFADTFAAKSPQSPPQGSIPLVGDSLFGSESRAVHDEPPSAFGGQRQFSEQQPPRQNPESMLSADTSGIPFNAMREQQPRPQSGRVNDLMFDPPSRGAASPEINIQHVLAQQRQRPPPTSNESQQLLNLLKKDSRPPSQTAAPGNPGMDNAQLQHWIESQQRSSVPAEPHAPKPRLPQGGPGAFEEQLMRNFPRQEQHQEQGPPGLPGMQDMHARRTSQRAPPPPGFYDEQSIFLQHQQQQAMRRQFENGGPAQGPPPQQQQMPPNRRMSQHPSLPQMQIPPQQAQQFPPEYHQLTSPGGGQAPPPGFNPHMPRHPPGFHSINIFQGGPQQREGPPPPGQNWANMQSPPGNAPPGFFGAPPGAVPPGFMRGPADGIPPGLPMRMNNGFVDMNGGGMGGRR